MYHGLKYSHSQFRIWDINHNRKTCSKSGRQPSCKNPDADEGEHDFAVFGPDFIILIEVKNPILTQIEINKAKDNTEQIPASDYLKHDKNPSPYQAAASTMNDNEEEKEESPPSKNLEEDKSLWLPRAETSGANNKNEITEEVPFSHYLKGDKNQKLSQAEKIAVSSDDEEKEGILFSNSSKENENLSLSCAETSYPNDKNKESEAALFYYNLKGDKNQPLSQDETIALNIIDEEKAAKGGNQDSISDEIRADCASNKLTVENHLSLSHAETSEANKNQEKKVTCSYSNILKENKDSSSSLVITSMVNMIGEANEESHFSHILEGDKNHLLSPAETGTMSDKNDEEKERGNFSYSLANGKNLLLSHAKTSRTNDIEEEKKEVFFSNKLIGDNNPLFSPAATSTKNANDKEKEEKFCQTYLKEDNNRLLSHAKTNTTNANCEGENKNPFSNMSKADQNPLLFHAAKSALINIEEENEGGPASNNLKEDKSISLFYAATSTTNDSGERKERGHASNDLKEDNISLRSHVTTGTSSNVDVYKKESQGPNNLKEDKNSLLFQAVISTGNGNEIDVEKQGFTISSNLRKEKKAPVSHATSSPLNNIVEENQTGLPSNHLKEGTNLSLYHVETSRANNKDRTEEGSLFSNNTGEDEHSSLPQLSSIISTTRNPIASAYEKASQQFEKGMKLLEGIANCTKSENFTVCDIQVFHWVALPNISKNQAKDVNADTIYKEDFEDFDSFWLKVNPKMPNVKSRSTISGDIHSIQSVILRLFASVISVEKKKRKLTKTSEDLMDETKLSLKECVIEIDRQLRSSEITFRGKNTPPNPSVIKTSDLKEPPFVVNGINIFQTCLGVNYITIEQSRAFEDDNYPILITGAVGSGKTLVLLATRTDRNGFRSI